MARIATESVVRQLESLLEGGSVAGLSDRQLLERYIGGERDPVGEAAFAALVSRHGPLVLGVCRQLLGNRHHAEDAFQAVFLVLARKARSIRDPDLLGNWLYGVAIRTARCAKHQMTRRRLREGGDVMNGADPGPRASSEPTAPPADRPAIDREQAEALHDEVDRLPRTFRLPVVLCYFEGLTLEEAARRLRCPSGTLRSRLARARDKLRRGLARRGIVVPAAALGAFLAPGAASASVSSLLCDTTTRAATVFATRHAARGILSASATTLAQEVLRTMLFHKLRLTAITLLLLATAATGAGWLSHSLAMKDEPAGEPDAPLTKHTLRSTAPTRPETKPDALNSARMTVSGRVVDPGGKPVAGAVVDLVARPRTPWVAASDETNEFKLLGQGQAGADGRYRLEAPRTASNRVFEVFALATAPGHGLVWAELNPDAEQPGANLTLPLEEPVRARLVDVSGAPARGVEVRVLSVGRATKKGTFDGISLWATPPQGTRAWPRPVTTDDQGKLTFHGLGRDVGLNLSVRDLRYARQDPQIPPGGGTGGKEVTLALEPARIIEGRVLAADTGQPIPNAVVSTTALIVNEHARGYFTAKYRADAEGRFTMNPSASDKYTLGAFPTHGEPYLIRQDELSWTKGMVKATHDIKLRRGVVIRGKVAEAGTHHPLAASSIQFIPVQTQGGDEVLWGWQAIVASRDDGSFEIAVAPGKGHILVFGPTGDYVLGEIGSNRLFSDRPGGQRYHAHAIIPYEVKADDPPLEIAPALRPGVTIKGRVEGPDGQTITDGFILTTLRIEAFNPFWRGDYHVPVREGRFELHGLDPDGATRIHVLDPEHEWGASADVSGKQAGKDMIIRLQPCGKATARFVGPDARPIAGYAPHIEFVATPGPSTYSLKARNEAELAADAELLANVDRKHYWNPQRSDAEGRVIFSSLIPGALYRIIDFSTVNDPDKGVQVRKDFTVKAGETLDLGEIRIDKPQAQ